MWGLGFGVTGPPSHSLHNLASKHSYRKLLGLTSQPTEVLGPLGIEPVKKLDVSNPQSDLQNQT